MPYLWAIYCRTQVLKILDRFKECKDSSDYIQNEYETNKKKDEFK